VAISSETTAGGGVASTTTAVPTRDQGGPPPPGRCELRGRDEVAVRREVVIGDSQMLLKVRPSAASHLDRAGVDLIGGRADGDGISRKVPSSGLSHSSARVELPGIVQGETPPDRPRPERRTRQRAHRISTPILNG